VNIKTDLPTQFETERLLIRMPQPGDGAELNAAVLESFTELHLWMPWAQTRPTVAESEEYTLKTHEEFVARKSFDLRLFLKGTGTLVGSSGFHAPDWTVPKFEIGYWCRTRFVGQGYITEAVRGITRYGFEHFGARRIEIRCDIRNVRSARVAERAGYRLEATLHNDRVGMDGQLSDTLVYVMLPEALGT
jgi:RimJ/RimL family protein N-acetyltransferase